MARKYSGKKGKSGSKKPVKKTKQVWLRYSDKEVEQLIIKLSKQDNTQSKIGTILRDTYGVPDVRRILNKKIGKILDENKINKLIKYYKKEGILDKGWIYDRQKAKLLVS